MQNIYIKTDGGKTVKAQVMATSGREMLVKLDDSNQFFKLHGVEVRTKTENLGNRLQIVTCELMEPVEVCFHLFVNDAVLDSMEMLEYEDTVDEDDRFEFSSYEAAIEWLQEAPRDFVYHVAVRPAVKTQARW